MSACPHIHGQGAVKATGQTQQVANTSSTSHGREWTPLRPEDESDEEILLRLGVRVTDVARHAVFFVDRKNGEITPKIIEASFNSLGLKINIVEAEAAYLAFAGKGCTNIRDILSLMHTPHTGMFYQAGENIGDFDPVTFDEKCRDYARDGFFSKESINQMLSADKAEGVQALTGCVIRRILFEVDAFAAKQELTTLEELSGDPRGISVELMRSIHTEGSKFFRQKAQEVRYTQGVA